MAASTADLEAVEGKVDVKLAELQKKLVDDFTDKLGELQKTIEELNGKVMRQGPRREEPEDAEGEGGPAEEETRKKDKEKDVNKEELTKDFWQRKNFDKRLKTFTNEKGEDEYSSLMFDLKKITAEDLNFRQFLEWLE